MRSEWHIQMNKIATIACFFLLSLSLSANPPVAKTGVLEAESNWVDSLMRTLTLEEKIGQLFMIRAHSDKGVAHEKEVKEFIEKYHVGGLCFFQGTPEKQSLLLNEYQELSSIPLMVAMDAEWGLGMRMKNSTISFPRQLSLGAIQNNKLIYDMGKEIARQLKEVGVHINFAPVVDVNNNPNNPVIHTRSFGEDRMNVSVKSYMYAQGLQDNGIMACAKHFPGHGDTDVDSHLDLPVFQHDFKRLDSIELYPFKVLIQHGVGSMMVAHLEVPSVDATFQLPSTLSKKVITALLKKKLGFKGLVFTDALEMKGVTKNYPCGEIEVRAMEAGNDILLLPEDLEIAFNEVKKAVEEGRLSMDIIDTSVRKILHAKYELGLSVKPTPIDTSGLNKRLNTVSANILKKKLISSSLTLAKNTNQLIPFKSIADKRFASVCIGIDEASTPFQEMLSHYADFEHFTKNKLYSDDSKEMMDVLVKKDIVVVGVMGMNGKAGQDFNVSPSTVDFIEKLGKETKVVVVVFGTPYALRYFDNAAWVVEAFDDEPMVQDMVAQALFGATSFRGRLPITASPSFQYNNGENTTSIFRMGFALPEEVGMSSEKLERIDRIANESVLQKVAPGCVVLVAREGKIVYHKAFGKMTYDAGEAPLDKDAIFDLASITKTAATTIALMRLKDEGKVDINSKLGPYLPGIDSTNKKDLVITDLLAHRAGLKSWIPFYKNTVLQQRRAASKPSPKYYSSKASVSFSLPVVDNLFLKSDYKQDILSEIYASEVYETRKYRYSDIGFYLLNEVVDQVSGTTLDKYMNDKFYKEMGLKTMTFNPWAKFPKEKMVPTEEDRYFRYKRIQGYVHDMGAAMLGGVAGHAGLFSDAEDLAILYQMLLNKGYYGGQQFLSPQTVKEFTTRCGDCSRRGLGFDMKQMDPTRTSNLPDAAAPGTFGHLGFTGTCVWADPDENLIYVFLSNRTYPSMRNYKINKLEIRERIHEAIYESIVP
ncbi:MAG: serine hydrolase [Saprospiraceae bacterium]|nr:serine hydrolase [Saprospiraceae bacterium]